MILVLLPFMLMVELSMVLFWWGATALVGPILLNFTYDAMCIIIILPVFLSPENATRPPWRNIFQSPFFKKHLILVAVDEAHCIPEWLE